MSTDFRKPLVPTHDQIARRAYEIYLERGAIDGNHEEHWFLAEQELKARLQFEELLQKFKVVLRVPPSVGSEIPIKTKAASC